MTHIPLTADDTRSPKPIAASPRLPSRPSKASSPHLSPANNPRSSPRLRPPCPPRPPSLILTRTLLCPAFDVGLTPPPFSLLSLRLRLFSQFLPYLNSMRRGTFPISVGYSFVWEVCGGEGIGLDWVDWLGREMEGSLVHMVLALGWDFVFPSG